MKSTKGYIIFAIVIFIILVATSVVFVNSALDFEASHYLSGLFLKLFSGDKTGASDDFLIRKIAHLAEYAFLGGALTGFSVFLKKKYGKNIFVFSALYAVAVACADEYIQSLSDRNGTVADVFLDLIGAAIGFAAVFGMVQLIKYIKRHKSNV